MRIALGIEYDGTNYHGWQSQTGLSTIQEQVELAVSKIAEQPIKIICAGRTDAGVHALEQVVHFDTAVLRPDIAWVFGPNSNLPADIRILWARAVSEDFHARFSAISRQYNYKIYCSHIAAAIWRNQTVRVKPPLDVNAMHAAGQYLVGRHDFSSFRGSGCQANHPVRNIILLNVTQDGAIINIEIKANAFLLHMVRCIVGMLIKIGAGEQPAIWAKEVLAARDRRVCPATASPQGLYFVKAEYNS
jgi:tRNA pseudouridine38-40 synthase